MVVYFVFLITIGYIDMTPVVCYYRTSSQTNVGEDKDTLKRQRHSCIQLSKDNGYTVAREFYDEGVKGKDHITDRQGFTDLLSFCEEEGIKTILFENSSRFSRDLVVQEMGYRMLVEMGFTLISTDNPNTFIEDNPTTTMVRQILGSVSQYQKDELVVKLRVSRERKREVNKGRGIITLTGQGKCEGRKSIRETNPDLIKTVKRLRRKNRKTHKRMSYRKVSGELYRMGFANGKGNRFDPNQVKEISLM